MNTDCSFYLDDELKTLGLKYVGRNVLLSRKASLYRTNCISIGDNTRIDDFCVLSGNIEIGKNVHIAVGCYFFAGEAGIEIQDYCGVSSRTAIYAESDDYSGNYLSNPTFDSSKRNVTRKKVILKKHVLIATGCTIMPGAVIEEGCAVGAMSLVNKSLKHPWFIYLGSPCRALKVRSQKMLDLL